MSLLDDLDLSPEDLVADVEDIEVPEPEWTGPMWQRPVPMFVGDWFARAHDAGLPYDLLVANVARFAVHLAPPSDTDLPRRQQRSVRRPTLVVDQPLHTTIALTRAHDETDREHLARLGRQVQVFDLPLVEPFFGRDVHHSVFADCALEAAGLTALADSPLTVDRLVLTTRFTTAPDVLDRLSTDPAVGVRIGVASHPNIAPATAERLLGDAEGNVYAAAMTNPAVAIESKETVVKARGLTLAVEQAVLRLGRSSKGSARRLAAVARP